MAVDGNVYASTEFRFAIAEEATFGTAIVVPTADASYNELCITEPPQIDWGNLITDRAKKADGSRVSMVTDNFVSKAGTDFTVSVSGIATDETIDFLIYGVMQDLVSEATSTPFLKTFEWDESSGSVDFSANAGKLYTLVGYDPDGASWQLRSAFLRELTLTADPGTNGGRLSYTATFMSGFIPTVSGVTTVPTNWNNIAQAGTAFYPFQTLATKTLDGNDIVLGSMSLTFNNSGTRVGYDSSGEPQNYIIGSGGDNLSLTGEIVTKYDSNSAGALTAFLLNPANDAQASIPLVITWGDGSSDGTVSFTINPVFTGNAKDFGNDAGVFVNLPFMGVGLGSGNEAIVVTIANAKDRSW